jgi:hypothetical protein
MTDGEQGRQVAYGKRTRAVRLLWRFGIVVAVVVVVAFVDYLRGAYPG